MLLLVIILQLLVELSAQCGFPHQFFFVCFHLAMAFITYILLAGMALGIQKR